MQECMPYLSRRLLTDNNPRMRAALRTMLYGDGQRLDVERLQSLISSFGSFSTSTTSSSSSKSTALVPAAGFGSYEERIKGSSSSSRGFGGEEAPLLNETMREALKVVFAKDGSYAQEVRAGWGGAIGWRTSWLWCLPRFWLPFTSAPLPSPTRPHA